MAIINVRTGLKQAVDYTLRTGVLRHMSNGTRSGASNTFNSGSATNHFGKTLNFISNRAAARELPYVRNTRFTPLP